MIEKVLVADDEPLMLRFIADLLKRLGKEVLVAKNGQEAIELLGKEPVDLVITDMKMPHKTGLDVLKAAINGGGKKMTICASEAQPDQSEALRVSGGNSNTIAPRGRIDMAKPQQADCHLFTAPVNKISSPLVVLATAHGTIESAVEAMKLGAFHYLIKPFSPEALEGVLEKAEEHLRLVKENTFYREDSKRPLLVAESPAMKKILQDLEKIAKSHASVFITGESGTGKEVIAGAIHELSSRAQYPFIKVNCAAIPETLLESEFFGHERGAFTGAHIKKIGRFELADKGTLLLDEVTEIPLVLQPKLLRAIQEQEFERVGGTRPLKVNLRFLATSNRSMQEAIETKIFREDLFYRLNVVPIQLPPLRERKEDLLPLATHFLERFCKENHKPMKGFTEAARKKLLDYPWPGNVRELANILERTVVLDFAPVIDAEHLYLDSTLTAAPKELKKGITLHEMEKRLILETLEENHQNRTKTAAILGISVRTLRNKLHEYGECGLEN